VPPSRERRQELERRREAVWRMHAVQRVPVSQIAEFIDVSVRQIERDLRRIRQEHRRQLEECRASRASLMDELATVAAQFDAVIHNAWVEFAQAAPGTPGRTKALNIALRAATERLSFLEKHGVLPELPAAESALPFNIRTMTSEELDFFRQLLLLAKAEIQKRHQAKLQARSERAAPLMAASRQNLAIAQLEPGTEDR
jgi:hypothetical protein